MQLAPSLTLKDPSAFFNSDSECTQAIVPQRPKPLRRKPKQARAQEMVEVVFEAAARILRNHDERYRPRASWSQGRQPAITLKTTPRGSVCNPSARAPLPAKPSKLNASGVFAIWPGLEFNPPRT